VIELAYNINVSFQQQADIISLWLERSCSFPLSIRLNMDDDEGVYASKALSSIIVHHSRWEYLKLVPHGISRDTLGFPATEGSIACLCFITYIWNWMQPPSILLCSANFCCYAALFSMISP
jgi:hypothetical protein